MPLLDWRDVLFFFDAALLVVRRLVVAFDDERVDVPERRLVPAAGTDRRTFPLLVVERVRVTVLVADGLVVFAVGVVERRRVTFPDVVVRLFPVLRDGDTSRLAVREAFFLTRAVVDPEPRGRAMRLLSVLLLRLSVFVEAVVSPEIPADAVPPEDTRDRGRGFTKRLSLSRRSWCGPRGS